MLIAEVRIQYMVNPPSNPENCDTVDVREANHVPSNHCKISEPRNAIYCLLVRKLHHGPISECPLAKLEKAYTPSVNDSNYYHFIASFEGHEWVGPASGNCGVYRRGWKGPWE